MEDNDITIRSMEHRDLKLVHKWRNDPRVRRNMFSPKLISSNDHAVWFETNSNDAKCHLLLVLNNDVPFGFAQFKLSNCKTVADWGFYVDPSGPKGQGSYLGQAILSFGYETLRLHRVVGQVLNDNQSSIELHKRLGFTSEGILRSHHLTEQGYQDVHFFGLLSVDWKNRLQE